MRIQSTQTNLKNKALETHQEPLDFNLLEILLVEDNTGDAELLKTALKEVGGQCRVTVVPTGEAASAYLGAKAPFVDAIIPNLLILDLNLPGKDGREVLADIKKDSVLKNIPVIVFTGSRAEEDILICSELEASSFIIKPMDWPQYIETANYIREFWINPALLPPVWLQLKKDEQAKLKEPEKAILQELGAAEHALTQAQFHLNRTKELLHTKDHSNWARMLLLALNIKAAWESIHRHWENARSANGIYQNIEYDAPWLSSRVSILQKKLKALEAETTEFAREIEKISGSTNPQLAKLRTGIDRILNDVQHFVREETNLEYSAMAEPPALD